MTHALTHRRLPLAGIPVLALGLTLIGPAASHAQTVQGMFERTLSVSGPVDLDVSTGSGDITIRQGPAGSVRVIGRIRASRSWFGTGPSAEEKVKALEAKPPIEQTGSTLRIGRIEDRELRQNVSITYEITVPAQCTLRSQTGSGDQNVADLSGPVEIGSGSGDLIIGNIGGRVDVSTGSGDIAAGTVGGSFNARTGSGSVRAGGVSGEITVSTGSGDIEVSQTAPGAVRVNAASGDITLKGIHGLLRASTSSGDVIAQGTPTADWQVSSASGDITLEVPQTAGFELDAQSSSGRIDSKHPVTVIGSIERHALQGKVRSGGPLVRVRTSSGTIRVR
ncbi:MAG: DUF4097 family beta strand repeat protein [Gemmatimonadetes bacterium]|nr:DUF4097 family beta strand repeat protein [Gemmatimonadota bacterium]